VKEKNKINFANTMKAIFNIADYLPSTVTTRKAIDEIRSNFNRSGESTVTFNFANIDFISRAFADELLHFIEKNNMQAQFINTTSVVGEMLKAVKKNRKHRNNGFHNIAVTYFHEKEQLNQLLSLI
jgi:predicted RND superfamily exporter protein